MVAPKARSSLLHLRRAIFWLGSAILAGLGIWCLYSAFKLGISSVVEFGSAPADTRIAALVSCIVGIFFFIFTGVSGASSFYLGIAATKISIRNTFRLSLLKLVVLIAVIGISVFAFSERNPTTKVTWEENRGVPLAFLVVTELRGPVWPTRRVYESVSFFPLLANISVTYYAICVSGQTLQQRRGG